MPNKCCVPGCKSTNNDYNKYVTTFKLPSEGTMREEWLKVIPRKDWLPTKSSFVCIKHFQPDDIHTADSYTDHSGVEHFFPPSRYPRLKANAIPTIFPDLPETMVGNPSSHKKVYTNRFPTDKTRRFPCEHKVKIQHWKPIDACRLCKPVKRRKLQKTRICSKSASMSSCVASSSNQRYPLSKDMPKTSNENILPEVNIECEDSTRAKTQQESEADGCPDLCLEVEEELQESEHSEDESTEEDWESFDEHSRVTKGVQYWPVRLSKVVGVGSDWAPNCDAGSEPIQNDQLPSMESQTEGGSNAEYEPSININIDSSVDSSVDSSDIETHKVSDTVEHASVYARERMYTNAELFVPENVKQLSKSSSCKIQKVPNDQEQDLSTIRDEMLIQEALACQPELSDVFDHNEQINNSCLQPMNEAIAGNDSTWLMEDAIPSTFVKDSSLMVIRPDNHFKSSSGSRKQLLESFSADSVSVGRKKGRPRKKPHGDIECTKHLEGDRAVNANETSNEASNIIPVNHPTNPWSSDNLLGSCYDCSTRYVSVDSEFQPSAGKLVACGSQAPNFVHVWFNRTSVEHSPIKRSRGRTTLKSKSLERRANKPINVSILNCGHACSKCNSAQTTKWLKEHDYAANPPLSFSINDD